MTKFTNGAQNVHVPATVRLMDGTLLIGTVDCGLTGKLDYVLGQDNAFIEFRSRDGQQRFITRHQIASIEPVEKVTPPAFPATSGENDPYRVLQMLGERTLDNAREAYMRLTKMYHPDKWSSGDIPPEIKRYAAEKTSQINNAYTIVRAELQEAEKKQSEAAMRAQHNAEFPNRAPMQDGTRRMFGTR